MSGIDQRSAAFLREMGITPLWTARAAPPADAIPVEEAVIATPAQDPARPIGAR